MVTTSSIKENIRQAVKAGGDSHIVMHFTPDTI
jgi:hypothetical protein